MFFRRRHKNNIYVWHQRWDRALAKLWATFDRLPASEKSLLWAERNSLRLCHLSARKCHRPKDLAELNEAYAFLIHKVRDR
jgi:hypothetical protein